MEIQDREIQDREIQTDEITPHLKSGRSFGG
jgi:hypothetical protein